MLLHKIHAIFILPSIVLAYDLLCPDVSQRQLRSQGLCTRKNDTNTVYTCLEDVNKKTYNESCSEKEGVLRPGRKYVYVGLATDRECPAESYQPIPFHKSSGAMCLFLKSTCHEVGQMVANNAQILSDTTCICDFTEGYAYVTRPSDPCNCVPAEEDCTCYEKMCPESHLLSADYECIHRNAPSVTTCDIIYKSEKKFTTTTSTTVGTDSTDFNESPSSVKYVDSAAISVTVMIFAILILSAVFLSIHESPTRVQYFVYAAISVTVMIVMLLILSTLSLSFNVSPTRAQGDVSVALYVTVIMFTIHILYGLVFIKWYSEAQTLVVESQENMALSEEELHIIRIVTLVISVAPKAVRHTFDEYFPPVSLTTIMKREEPKLKALQAKNQLTTAQMALLFPTAGVTSSKSYDVSLMICLLRNLTEIRHPENGFGVLPPSTENHVGADLARVKYYRNKITLSEIGRIPMSEFTTVWNDLEQAFVRLGDSDVKATCDDISLELPYKTSYYG